jgi:putative oxidoreductase
MRKHVIPTLSILLGLYFVAIAVMGFIGAAPMVKTFDAIGIGQWFRYVTACCQLLGGVLLLRPRTRLFGAMLVCCVLIGAVITRILFMKVTPLPAIILLAIAGAILLHTAMTKRRKA